MEPFRATLAAVGQVRACSVPTVVWSPRELDQRRRSSLPKVKEGWLRLGSNVISLAERAMRPDHAKNRPTWAELLKRVFEIDVLTCPWCAGKRELIALVNDGAVVRRILEHLGLPAAAPLLAPARSPPELEFA